MSFRELFRPSYEQVSALDGVSFCVRSGEMIGYIGPNGAGKSTTIKLLCGVLSPSGGRVIVNGYDPFRERVRYARTMAAVFGHRNQLSLDLPAYDTYELLRYIYRVPGQEFRDTLDYLRCALRLTPFWNVPVRELSLGQRMRANLAAAFIHRPSVVFLDEPTVGMDVVAKSDLRQMLRRLNEEKNTLIMLTSHDLGDIEDLCRRIIMIDQGRLLYDGTVADLLARFGSKKTIVARLRNEEFVPTIAGASIRSLADGRIEIEFDSTHLAEARIVTQLDQRAGIVDLTVASLSLESVIKQIYLERR